MTALQLHFDEREREEFEAVRAGRQKIVVRQRTVELDDLDEGDTVTFVFGKEEAMKRVTSVEQVSVPGAAGSYVAVAFENLIVIDTPEIELGEKEESEKQESLPAQAGGKAGEGIQKISLTIGGITLGLVAGAAATTALTPEPLCPVPEVAAQLEVVPTPTPAPIRPQIVEEPAVSVPTEVAPSSDGAAR